MALALYKNHKVTNLFVTFRYIVPANEACNHFFLYAKNFSMENPKKETIKLLLLDGILIVVLVTGYFLFPNLTILQLDIIQSN